MAERRRGFLVAGNWKMGGSRAGVQALAAAVGAGAAVRVDRVQLVVLPPLPYLGEAQRQLQGSGIAWGAQDVSEHEGGAYTGEVSGATLREFGCACVLVGHSERRLRFAESDAVVARKFLAARQAGLTPLLCVGESRQEREQGRTEAVLARQLQAVRELAGPEAFADAVIAYEPLWAAGGGAVPDEVQAAHGYIRRWLAQAEPETAAALHIVYGGPLKRASTRALLSMPDIDGGLLGGASLNLDELMAVAITAQQLAQQRAQLHPQQHAQPHAA